MTASTKFSTFFFKELLKLVITGQKFFPSDVSCYIVRHLVIELICAVSDCSFVSHSIWIGCHCASPRIDEVQRLPSALCKVAHYSLMIHPRLVSQHIIIWGGSCRKARGNRVGHAHLLVKVNNFRELTLSLQLFSHSLCVEIVILNAHFFCVC